MKKIEKRALLCLLFGLILLGGVCFFIYEDWNEGGAWAVYEGNRDVYADGEWQYPAEDSEVMVIHTLIISRKTDLKGLGSDFLAYYEAFALEHGCKYLRLDTNARNAAARAFYKRHGYKEIGIVPTVFNGIPGVDLVLLEKKLG